MASIPDLIHTGVTIVRISRKLRKISQTLPNLNIEIARSVLVLESSGKVIKTTFSTLKELRAAESQATLWKHMDKLGVLEHLSQGAEAATARLRELPDRLRALHSRFKIWTAVKWMEEKHNFDDIGHTLEQVKLSASLLMQTAMYEANLREEKRTNDPLYKARLARDNRLLLNSLEDDEKLAGSFRKVQDHVINAEDPLVEVLNSLMDLVDKYKDLARRHQAEIQIANTPAAARHPSVPAMARAAVSSQRRSTTARKHTTQPAPSRTVTFTRKAPSEPNTRSERDTLDRGRKSEDSQLTGSPVASPNSGTRKKGEIRVRYEPGEAMATTAYISKSSDESLNAAKHTTGMVYPNFPHNLMSIHMARSLDLELDELDEVMDHGSLKFPDGRVQSITYKTYINVWEKVGTKPMQLKVYILDHLKPEIIFGATFSPRPRPPITGDTHIVSDDPHLGV